MPVTDPIADMLTCIRNALHAGHRRVDVPASRMKSEILGVMHRESFIRSYKTIPDDKQGVIRVYLKYTDDNRPVIRGLKRVSTPGRRIYVKKDEVPLVLRGLGTAIVSTSQGLLTDKEARERGVGGELVATVW